MRTLRDRVNIQENTPVESGRGDEVESWSTVYSDVPCDIQPLRGREFYDAQQINAEITFKVYMRWAPNIDSKMRLVGSSATYEVIGPPINIDNLSRELELMCRVLS